MIGYDDYDYANSRAESFRKSLNARNDTLASLCYRLEDDDLCSMIEVDPVLNKWWIERKKKDAEALKRVHDARIEEERKKKVKVDALAKLTTEEKLLLGLDK